MKNIPNEEKNIYQKYDDLFAEQDKKYDKNNGDRYKAKKISVPQDDQAFFDKREISQKRNNKNAFNAAIGIFVFMGFFGFFLFSTRLGLTIPWVFMFIVVGIVVSMVNKAKKK